jgi:phosphoribosylformylglycinamidine synthase subunit PurQ / glutaminase
MKFGVLVFPGSNCDHDAYHVAGKVAGQPVTFLWHESHDLENCDVIVVPGGFAYGDYLRTGAIARFSPVMEAVAKYVCKFVHVRVENADTPFTNACREGEVLRIPIGHMEGNYFCDEATLAQLERERRVVFRYASADGEITQEANPNGSLANIAGICSAGGNVLGMMPHPERAAEPELGGSDGFKVFESLVGVLARR